MLVIPTYNERDNIRPLVERVRRVARAEKIFFVDDGSPDGTAEEIRRLQQHDPGIRLLTRPGKGGYGSACRTAIKTILNEGLDDHIIQFDADLSHPPEALPTMLELLKTNPVVIGSRYTAKGGTQNWSFSRRMLSKGGNFYARLLTGIPARDVTAGFVGYRAEVLRGINLDAITSEGYAFLMEMKFTLKRSGARFREFPIIFAEREAGKSKFGRRILLEGMRYPLKAFRARIMGGTR